MVDPRTPLSQRVPADAVLALPVHPDIARWRPATDADVNGIWELRQAMGSVDHPNYLTARGAIAADFGYSHFHAEVDSIVGLDAAGRIVANGMVMFPPRQVTLVRSIPIGGVHPDLRGRGVGRVLLDWQLGRARQQLASSQKTLPGWVFAYADERAPHAARLFASAGMQLTRYFLTLERALDAPVRSVEPAVGIRIAQYRPEDSAAVHATRDDAFLDHWASQPMSDENWNAFVGGRWFRADLSFVAFGTDENGTEHVVGFVLATANENVWATQGFTGSYIDLVGVRSGWRGRHIAQSLLAAQLAGGQALGHEKVTLAVDSDSPTGALGLYTGMGFVPTHRKMAYTLEF
ncbi:MAG: GNAT family N-acetyltransferase [Cryobacterium sp.]|uniref:GNAT family N-acetyltransferase n=1 Tax=unclassified Cryobacterium TaxID=2649013 RepID=UPI0018CB625A|nr:MULTISPECIES: GNAT family N-acetyltransferase [unclassified Cryobacterium]MCY7405658.1 GNAT family N-acetyltransferase [Cryobacterium sp.]MEC5153353.1 ribosomal protein S18 acetylase RimI-like enzyme [Cryobacterium sp. CAN_C3]